MDISIKNSDVQGLLQIISIRSIATNIVEIWYIMHKF